MPGQRLFYFYNYRKHQGATVYFRSNVIWALMHSSAAQNLEIFEKLTSLGGSTFLFGYIERNKIKECFFRNEYERG